MYLCLSSWWSAIVSPLLADLGPEKQKARLFDGPFLNARTDYFLCSELFRGRVSMLPEPLRNDREHSCCVPFLWHDHLYHGARQRCDVPWPHCHDARRL